MEQQKIISNGSGGMDKDTAPESTNLDLSPKFNPLDYSHAENMQVISPDVSNSDGRTSAIGNIYVSDLGTVIESEKKIRAYYSVSGVGTVGASIIIYDADGVTILYQSGSSTITPATNDDIDAYIENELNTVFTTNDFTLTHTSGYDYTDIVYTASVQEWFFVLYLDSTIQETAVVEEYIPLSLTGNLQPIGSKEINGDVFIFSTTLSQDGVGAIGVQEFDGTDYTYTQLIRGKNLFYGYYNLIDVDGEKNGDVVSLYYTDDTNTYRSFYYKGAYSTDGALKVNNPDNYYNLDDLDLQSQLEPQAPRLSITLSSQTQVGGGLTSGNKRYTYTLLTPFGQETEVAPLSNPINVFLPSLSGTEVDLCGSPDGTITSKINVLNVSGVNTTVFPKIKLICAEYTDTAVSVVEVGIFSTSLNDFTISHTGLENSTLLTTADLSSAETEVLHGLNIRILDSRLVRSNYVIREQLDYTDFFAAMTLTTAIKDDIESEGGGIDSAGAGMVAGGYFEPSNVNSYAGYMDNETYRIGGRVKYKNGGYSNCFRVSGSDFTIDAGTDISLTTTGGTYIRARYIEVGNIDYNLLPTGVTTSDIEGIEILRAECVPEILATGYSYPLYGYLDGANYYWFPFLNNSFVLASEYGLWSKMCSFISPDLIFRGTRVEYQGGDSIYYSDILESYNYTNNTYRNNPATYSWFQQLTGYIATANYSTMELVDTFYTDSNINSPTSNTAITVPSASTNQLAISYGGVGNNYYCANQLTIANPAGLGSHKTYYNRLNNNYSIIVGSSNIITSLDNDVITDYQGIYLQYYRPLTNKYGAVEDTIYIPTGAFVDTSATTIDVWGGDTFIEKTTYKFGIMDTPYDANQKEDATCGVSFYSQNRVHSQMRDQETGGYIFPFSLQSTGTWVQKVGAWMEQEVSEGLFYTEGYTIRNDANAFAPYDSSLITTNDYNARIDWSDSKPIGSLIDYYSIFRPLNFRDLDSKYGEIIHMDVSNGELVTWQNYNKFMRQFFNNDAVLNTIDASTVLVGDGSVMSRRGIEISNIGATHKWGVAKGRSKGGNDVFTWINTRLGLYVRFGYDGTIVLSDEVNFKRWFVDNTRAVNKFVNTTMDWGTPIVSVWDDQKKEFLLSVRSWASEVEWAGDVEYLWGDVVFYGASADYYGIPRYWKSKKGTTLSPNLGNDPLTDVGEWWEEVSDSEYINHYTLAFSEQTNRFTTFYGYVPKLYMKWQNSYYTACPLNFTESSVLLANNRIYSHLIGEVCEWWEGTMYDLFPDLAQFDVTGYICELIAPISYMSGLPDQTWVMIVKYDELSEFVRYNIVSYSGTDITLETPVNLSGTISEIYIAPTFVYTPSIEYMINPTPFFEKRFHAIQVNSDTEPKEVNFYTSTQESYLLSRNPLISNASDFDYSNGDWRSSIHNDTTTTGDNTDYADPLWGKYLKVKVSFNTFVKNTIFSLLTKYRDRNRNIR